MFCEDAVDLNEKLNPALEGMKLNRCERSQCELRVPRNELAALPQVGECS